MSQHIFKSEYQGRPVEILLGWDRPLQGYFMVIEKSDSTNEDDAYLYSNLDDSTLKTSHPDSMESFLQKLKQFGLSVPEKMIHEVCEDGKSNVGNKVVHHL